VSRNTENLTSVLMRLGLNRYEARAYITLLIRGVATASEVSDLSGIPYTRVYDVLSSLESKGFVVSVPGRPMKFQALDPDIALKNLLEIHREKLMNELHALEENVTKAMEVLSRFKPGAREYESIIRLRGSVSIRNFIHQLIRKCAIRVAEVHPSNIPSVLSDDDLREMKRKGISVAVRVLESMSVNVNLLVVDHSIIIYERGKSDSIGDYDSAIVINSKQISDLLYALVLH